MRGQLNICAITMKIRQGKHEYELSSEGACRRPPHHCELYYSHGRHHLLGLRGIPGNNNSSNNNSSVQQQPAAAAVAAQITYEMATAGSMKPKNSRGLQATATPEETPTTPTVTPTTTTYGPHERCNEGSTRPWIVGYRGVFHHTE